MTFLWLHRNRWAAVLAACGALMVSSCADGAPAAPAPSTSAPVSETQTPEPTDEPDPVATDRAGEPLVAPVRPAAMDNDDVAGAQAAAEYFMEVAGYAERSQDLTEFKALCDSESNFCAAVIDQVTADVEAGSITVGGSTEFTTARVLPPAEDPFYLVVGTLDRARLTGFDASGNVVFVSEGETDLDFAVAVQRQDDGWIIRGAEAGVVERS